MSRYQVGERARAPELSHAERLLSALSEVVSGIPAGLSPVETGRHVLRRGMAAIGASGGSASFVDSLGVRVEIVETIPSGSSLLVTAEAVARGEESWLSTARAIEARFPNAPTGGSGALALVRLGVGSKGAGGLA